MVEIGTFLEKPDYRLRSIQTCTNYVIQQLGNFLDFWKHITKLYTLYTWQTIVSTLHYPPVSENTLANKIEQQYIKH